MFAEEYLNKYRFKKTMVSEYIDELNTLRASAYNCAALGYGEYIKGSTPSDRTAALSVKIASKEKFVEKKARELEQLRKQIVFMIEQIPETNLQMVLKLRYLEGLTMQEIHQNQGFSLRFWYKKHTQALAELNKILSKTA